MAIGYRSDRERSLGVSVWDGVITAGDVVDYFVRLAEDPDWPPGHLDIADMTTASRIELPDRDLHDTLLEGTAVSDRLQRALVVRESVFAKLKGSPVVCPFGVHVTPFADLDRACAHLGVDPGAVQMMLADVRDELTGHHVEASSERSEDR